MGNHATDSPSALSRRRLCPGSRRIEAEYGAQTTSEAAKEGTHTHWLIEYCLTEDKLPNELIGSVMEDDDGEFTVDAERAERATVMVDYVLRRKAEMNAHMHIEVQVDPGAALGRINMWGTADCVLIGHDEIEVIDYKDGFQHVEPHDNDQLKAYLLGAIGRFGGMPTKMRVTIVQPRNVEQDYLAIGGEEVNQVELRRWMGEVKVDLDNADQPDAPALPGEKQCQWCSAKGACRARAENALDGISFPAVQQVAVADKPQQLAETVAGMNLSLLADDEITRMLPYLGVAGQVLKSIKEEATVRLKAGRTLGEYWLKKTYGNRSWAIDEETVAKRLATRGYKKADMYDQKLKSPTQILKKKDIEEKHRKYIEDKLIERRETGVKLAAPDEQGAPARAEVPADAFKPVSPQGEAPGFLQQPNFGD